ncbi:MAG: helix-turn-helix domain-containing protein [Desulfotomaculales bacterium]
MEWKLHELMGKRRLKIADVAREAGMAWDAVASIYHGRSQAVELKTLDKLCRALNCQPGDLLVYVPDGEDG